ncbi:thaumatin-like protein 1b isoform X1 [Cucurbita pepo subsp. pepo]|uniref:thaumatin-like protein 1b isoform X1 n=2 Tax=Cucurbita pepo subsp. pepo TaxID=3664 RepID=UPI000C9D2EB8|nr:thaumatin-like protein 1b isoform X1 [Cucurbita pepo subsp. pepo]
MRSAVYFSRNKEGKVLPIPSKPQSYRFSFNLPMDRSLLLATLFTLLLLLPDVQSTSFKLINKCRTTIWPGLLSGANTPQLPTTGFALRSGKSKIVPVPKSWSGRLWARTLCGLDSDGKFSCLTADCGSGKVECDGGGAKPPATLAEFTLNGADGLDFYDVSLVDGYNLPMLVVAKGGTRGGCAATGCLVDLNGACPSELRVARGGSRGGSSVACRSACEAFNAPQFCCSEAFSTPDTCRPSVYSEFFKHACPRSYSYAYDDKTSTFTCASADYLIIFCPLPYTSQKVLSARKDGVALPLVNKTMMYLRSRRSISIRSAGLTQY